MSNLGGSGPYTETMEREEREERLGAATHLDDRNSYLDWAQPAWPPLQPGLVPELYL